MKITLKLSAKQLSVLQYCFQHYPMPASLTKEERFIWSILNEQIIKISRKYIEITTLLTLFNNKKKYSFQFKYHEAYALEKYLLTCTNQALSDYDRNVVNLLTSTINKQLV